MGFKSFRDRLFEQFELRQDQARQQWSKLNQREQIILGAAGSVFALALLVFSLRLLGGLFSSPVFQTEQALDDIQKIQSMIGELRSLRLQVRLFDRQADQKTEDFQVTRYLEEQAQRFGVKIEELKPTRAKSSLVSDEEELFEFNLGKEVSLDQSLKFLEAVEAPLGLRLLSLQMKPNYTDPNKLEVRATIAHHKDL
ncbi:MAG: hypothetical protein COV44_05975 [Deltaproteobacteria bacterium CG11_big_fil_rev_8_21_14_0_20_45_16]|nr:MAG: hypothetical protein COV44_05975 [Deltaproteobacteria bacterium CG11_big_fil_rev_8_21_14_0_20_45_16]